MLFLVHSICSIIVAMSLSFEFEGREFKLLWSNDKEKLNWDAKKRTEENQAVMPHAMPQRSNLLKYTCILVTSQKVHVSHYNVYDDPVMSEFVLHFNISISI